MTHLIARITITFCSGALGWFIGNFKPAFPLVTVALAFILWDVQSAYNLGKRVHKKFPKKKDREQAKFASFKLGKMIDTIVKSTTAILLMFACRKWVCVGLVDIPLDYITAAIVCGWQLLSILENNASCPVDGDKDSKLWALLRKVLIDKTERHLDVNLDDIK